MGSALSQEFHKIDPSDRVDSLVELVKQCTYEQKLDFVEKLNRIMYRDFLAELPPALAHRVVSYLTIDEACVCLLVSRRWNQVVGGCAELWEKMAGDIGLTAAFKRESGSRYRSLKDLCIATRAHQRYVGSLSLRGVPVARCPADPQHSYHYAGKGVTLRYEENNSHAKITVERLDSLNTPVEIASFTTAAFSSRIKWAAASESRLLWKQLSGTWNSCSVAVGTDGAIVQWDDEPVSQAFHSISICPTCHLVAIVSEAEDDCEVWDLQVVKLTAGKTAARKTVYPVPLKHIQKSEAKIRHFLGGEVNLLSEQPPRRERGFCEAHRVLLQVDNTVSLHRLETIPKTEPGLISHRLFLDVKLSLPLHLFNPSRTTGQVDTLSNAPSRGPSKFVVSSDSLHLGLLHEQYLYTWSLASFSEEGCVDLIELNLPRDTQCIAVGSMYAILASNSRGTCTVLSVQSGEVFTSGTLTDISFNPVAQGSSRFQFFAPLVETWLSSLSHFESLPVAVVFDSSSSPASCKELQVVVGSSSQPRTAGLRSLV